MNEKVGFTQKEDKPSGIVNFLACCFPIVGLILYFVWKDDKPQSAKSVCKWAIIGTVLGVVIYIAGFLIGLFAEGLYYY